MIETELNNASFRMMKASDEYTNAITRSKLEKKGYVNNAHVSTITIINNTTAQVRLRADGAIIEFDLVKDNRTDLEREIDLIYRNTAKYAEGYL